MTVLGPENLAARAKAAGVENDRLLEAMRQVPRAQFVPPGTEDMAYDDQPIPIGKGQTTTQPSLSAQMIDALGLTGTENVLEVGTGFGYQTALLARVADRVWSVERFEDLARTGQDNLARHGADNVEVVVGDGTQGLPEAAPFDAVLVSAASPEVPQPLVDQLADGGRLVQPIGGSGADTVVLFVKRGERLERERALTGARFVRLTGEHGFGG